MSDMNRVLSELLEINTPVCTVNSFDTPCYSECLDYDDGDCEYISEVDIDFQKPENNTKLRDSIIKAGGSIGYDSSEVTVFFHYVDCTGIVEDENYNLGLLNALEGVFIQLDKVKNHLNPNPGYIGDFKIQSDLKKIVQSINWTY